MAKKQGIRLIANNKKAFHDYFIEDTFETGISLAGTEVKSLRMGKCSIKEAFVRIEKGEVCIYGMHISPYEKGNIFNKDPLRVRKLLLHRYEINKLEGKLKEQGIGVRYKYCGNTARKQGVLFSKNGFEFSGSKIDRTFSFTKLDNRFNNIQQQSQHRTTLLGNLSAGAGSYRSAFAGLFGGRGGGSTREEPPSVNLGKAGSIPLPPVSSPVGVSAEQLQRKPGESPEEHIARITALLDAAAAAMAIAAMDRRRRMEEQKRRAKMKL